MKGEDRRGWVGSILLAVLLTAMLAAAFVLNAG